MIHASTVLVAVGDTTPIQSWIKTNVIPLVILVVAVVVLLLSRKKNNKASMEIIIGVLLGLLVLGLAVPGTADNVSTWLASLVFGG